MMLGRYKQPSQDRRKRVVDYDDFLEEGEIITGVTAPEIEPTTDTPFVIEDFVIDPEGKKFAYYSSGGEDGNTYSVRFRITTNGTQVKNDTIEFDVEDQE